MENNGRNSNGRFKEGWAGGPGRPKKKSFADYFSETETEALVNMIKQELKGKVKSDIIKLTVEHIFGKPRQNIGIDGGEEGKAVPIQLLGGDSVSKNTGNRKDSKTNKKN